jgi:hypothetical protein
MILTEHEHVHILRDWGKAKEIAKEILEGSSRQLVKFSTLSLQGDRRKGKKRWNWMPENRWIDQDPKGAKFDVQRDCHFESEYLV